MKTEHGAVYVKDELVDLYKNDSNLNYLNFYKLSEYPHAPKTTITDTVDEILQAEQDGSYLNKYHIHDTKIFRIDGTDIVFEIVGFDKDDLADGSGKAHITWLSKYAYYYRRMTSTGDNVGGWPESEARTFLRNKLANSEQSVISAIKTVKKTSFYRDQTIETDDTIWVPS